MGAVRFTSEFKTSLDITYKVEIYDQDHTGSATAFILGSEGFAINWRGNNNDMFEPIVGSECSFTMMIQDATHEQFIVDIASSPESRFWIGIYKGSDLWWCGILASDIARVEDLDYPYAFECKAYDGLGLLKNSNYAANKYDPIRGLERFTTIIERCLNYLPHIAHYYNGSTNFLNTSVNWYEDSHTYAQTYDPLYHTFANNDVTYSAADQASWANGIYTYLSAYEVLANVMKVFGARIIHLEGRFIIEQLETRVTNSFFSRRYGYPVSTASAISLVDRASVKPSQSPPRRKKAGTYFTWFPALKEVRVAYPSLNRRNFWPAQNFSYAGSGPRAPETSTGYSIASGPGAKFQFSCNVTFSIPQYGWGSVISEGDFYYVVVKLLIKIVGDSSTKYLVRTIDQLGNATQTVWQQFAGTYDIKMPAFLALDSLTFVPVTVQSSVNIITPAVDIDGALSVNLSIEKLYGPDATNNLVFTEFDVANIFNFNYQISNPSLTLQETTSNVTTTIAENDDANNSAKYETEIIWADGDQPNTLGRLRTESGGVYTDTDAWGVKTVSGTQTIQELLAERILRMQKTPVRKMYTTVYGADFPLYKNLLDSSDDEWCMLGVTYNANIDEWQGEWFNIRINNNGTLIFQTEEAEQYPGTDNPPGPFGDTSTESFPGFGVAPATLEPLAAAVLANSYPSGSAPGSGISVNGALAANAFVQGQQIAIVNPVSGQFAYFEVTSDTAAGDTEIAVSGSFPSRFPFGSYIINLPSNYTASGGIGPAQGAENDWFKNTDYDFIKPIDSSINTIVSENLNGGSAFVISQVSDAATGNPVFVSRDITYVSESAITGADSWAFGMNRDDPFKRFEIGIGDDLGSPEVYIDAANGYFASKSVISLGSPPGVTYNVTGQVPAGAGNVSISGNNFCFTVNFTVGTAGIGVGQKLFTVELNTIAPAMSVPVYCPANSNAVEYFDRFMLGDITANDFSMFARVNMATNRSYLFNFFVGGY